MARPPLSILRVESRLIHSPAGVRFEIIHDFFRFRIRPNDYVNVVRPNVRGQ
jgi:hypothetical protein